MACKGNCDNCPCQKEKIIEIREGEYKQLISILKDISFNNLNLTLKVKNLEDSINKYNEITF